MGLRFVIEISYVRVARDGLSDVCTTKPGDIYVCQAQPAASMIILRCFASTIYQAIPVLPPLSSTNTSAPSLGA